MSASPLAAPIAFNLGPVPVATPVVTTWVIMAVLAGGSWLITRRLRQHPSVAQTIAELFVEMVEGQIRGTLSLPPEPYTPLIGTLLAFILVANWSSLLPGVEPPTGYLETDAALALIVFGATIWFGIRARGVGGWLASFAEPLLVMAPLNFFETFTRTFSLLVRLFGNVMGGMFIIGIVLSLAGLLVPIPFMALELLTGAIQAYIFSVLALVFIGGAMGGEAPPTTKEGT
jgi:F-type H+-transporting ATPase subunit a